MSVGCNPPSVKVTNCIRSVLQQFSGLDPNCTMHCALNHVNTAFGANHRTISTFKKSVVITHLQWRVVSLCEPVPACCWQWCCCGCLLPVSPLGGSRSSHWRTSSCRLQWLPGKRHAHNTADNQHIVMTCQRYKGCVHTYYSRSHHIAQHITS